MKIWRNKFMENSIFTKGSVKDADAILEIIRCGCSVIATMHGSCMEEMKERGIPETLFDCVVLLERRGREGEPFSILKRAGGRI